MLLEGEEFDDADIGPPLQRYRDYPGSMSSNSQLSGRPISPALTGYSNTMAQVAPLVATSSPHLLVRASESGSIFREAVWPPPGEPSRLVDPLLSASSQVDLGGIIDDVMGSHAASRPISFVAGHARRDTESSSEDRRHSRATSQTGLLPNRSESPLISQVKAHPPLFVTNATPPSPTHAVSPKNWLERSPQPAPKHDEDGDANIQMGEAL